MDREKIKVLYLTGSIGKDIRPYVDSGIVGYLKTPSGGSRMGRNWIWAADNGCFGKGWPGEVKWIKWLESHTKDEISRCLFATAPDVVGDHDATVARSTPLIPVLRSLGYRAAFVAQDGMTIDGSDWDFDVLFIGGSTQWKLGADAKEVIHEAHRRGIPVHVGRVNSQKRFLAFAAMGCATSDGTFLAFGPRKNVPQLLGWIEHLETHRPLFDMH